MTLRSFWEIFYHCFVILLPCFSDYLYMLLASKTRLFRYSTELKSEESISVFSFGLLLLNQWFSICGLWVIVGAKAISERSVKVTEKIRDFFQCSTQATGFVNISEYWNLFQRFQRTEPSMCLLSPSVCILLSISISLSPDSVFHSGSVCPREERCSMGDVLLQIAAWLLIALGCLAGHWLLLKLSWKGLGIGHQLSAG